MTCHSCPEQRLVEGRGGRIGDRSERSFCALVAAVCGFLILNGCAAFEIRTTTTVLSESGFLARVPETPKQREAYAALPPYKLHRGVTNGTVFYVYKDEKNGVVYIGTEQEYQRYMEKVRRLVAAYETTEQKMVAHDMDNDLAWRWYGSWGAFGASNPRD
jgi:hypothetical protein